MNTDFHVFVCGHYETEHYCQVSNEPYVFYFTERPCSDEQCQSTDLNWFRKQCVPFSKEEIQGVEQMAYEAHSIQTELEADLRAYDLLKPLTAHEVNLLTDFQEDMALEFFRAFQKGRGDELEHFLRLAVPSQLIHLAQGFGSSGNKSKRPFFNFCVEEAHFYLLGAQERALALSNAATRLRNWRRCSTHPDKTFCYCRESSAYEPDLGVQELKRLRSAGQLGKEVLAEPISLQAIRKAEVLVDGI